MQNPYMRHERFELFSLHIVLLLRQPSNAREYTWNVGTLESLLTKWRDECFCELKNRELRFWLVAVNDEIIPATSFSSMPISDGDTVFIAMGAVAGG